MEHTALETLPSYLPLALKAGVATTRAATFAVACQVALATNAAKNDVLPPRRKYTGLQVVGNVGVIDVKGVLDKEATWISWLMGDSTYDDIQDQLRDALERDEVTKILLLIDSPGGAVSGIDETRALIQAVNKKKTVYAHSNGCICSAAYALGSAASKLTITEMTEAGSIGIVMTHIDQSGFDKDMGFKVTEITAGEFKRAGSAHKPLDKKSLDYLQALVDKHMAVFKAWVQASRGYTDAELEAVANGALFIGTDALDLGLVDRIATYDDVLSSLQDAPLDDNQNELTTLQGVLNMEKNTVVLTMAMLQEQAPELVEQLRKEGSALVNVKASVDTAVEQAVTAERGRIKEIMELAPVGFEAEAASMAFEAPVSAAEAAKMFLKGAKEKGAQLLDKHRADAPKPIRHAATDQDPEAEADKEIIAATTEFNKTRAAGSRKSL